MGFVLAALAAAGCLADGEAPPETEARTGPINLGVVETGYPAVGHLALAGAGCTGTLIAPSWVLTAKHCDSTSITFQTGTDSSNFVNRTIDYKTLHPTLDMMLLHLVSPIDDIPIIRTDGGSSLPTPGTTCTAVGFGQHKDSAAGAYDQSPIKRSCTETVTGIPDNSKITVNTGSGIVDHGDSGGPLLCNGLIVGVAIQINPDVAWPGYNTAVYATVEAAWIERTIAPTYLDVTLQNGWEPSGTRTPGAALVGDQVHLKGTIMNGTAGWAFTLPATMVPSELVYLPIDLCAGKKGRLIIQTNGNATVSPLADAQCFASIDGVKFARNSRGYSPLTLAAGWSAYGNGTATPAVSKVDGIVRFRGAIGSTSPETSPFILPAGLRPAKIVYMPADLCGSANGYVVVTPAGAVGVQAANNDLSAVRCFTSLEGLEFPVEATFGYQILGLQNGWANKVSAEEPGMELISGVVHLKGGITTTGTNGNAFTLPAAFRPSRQIDLDIALCSGSKGRLRIASSGAATVSVPAGGLWSDAQCMASLDGVTFAQSDFTPLAPENGWRPYSTTTGRPAISVAGGIARFKGAIKSSASSAVAFHVPRYTNPTGSAYLPVDVVNGKKGRLRVAADGGGNLSDLTANWTDSKSFTSLEGVGYVLNPVAFSLSNGWVAYGGTSRPPGAVKIGDIVYLAGAIKTTGTNMNPINFAAGYRPEANVWLPLDINNGKTGFMKIQPDGTVTVGTTSAAQSDVQAFVSLEGVSFATSTSTFSSMTLTNNWNDGNLNTRHVKARNAAGIVQFAGAATTGANSSMFVLPSSMWPLSTAYVNVDLCGGTKGRIRVTTTGDVTVQSSTGSLAPAQCITSLEGAWFAIQ